VVSERRGGVNLLEDLSEKTLGRIAVRGEGAQTAGRSCHRFIFTGGGNWGYFIPPEQIEFAHRLIEKAGVNIVHGHSSHHARGIEVYQGRLILYGCGDFLNDYGGISGYESFRGDLALMYLANMDPATGKLRGLTMTPVRIKRLKLNSARREDALWLRDTLTREGQRFGSRAALIPHNRLVLQWE
jgi:poly-gamma-glutamate capsule biosynthesis protein CapA/YwtB (metallophosphatase superfamily)